MSSQKFGLSFFSIALIAFLAAPVFAGHLVGDVVYDFETDDFGATLVNGQAISTDPDVQPDTVFEFGNYAEISTVFGTGDSHEGAAIFDSDVSGPNDTSHDDDLLVNLGNILILQSEDNPATTSGTNGTVFTTPNDEASINTGSIIFDFTLLVEPLSIAIVDANGGYGAQVILVDDSGNKRTYTIPSMWTDDVSVSGNGWAELDLTITTDQVGENVGIFATAVTDPGYDPLRVLQLEMKFTGIGTSSGGIDNLKIGRAHV